MPTEIDARVAEEVMGFETDGVNIILPWNDQSKAADHKLGLSLPDGDIIRYWIPAYSTDMNAAMEVVEKMRERGWYLALESPRLGKSLWEAYFTHCDNATHYHDYNADTPSMAICLAALEAVKNEAR